MQTLESTSAGGSNHPLAPRMAIIAFINQNLVIGCLFGSFSVLLTAIEARLAVGRELSTLAIPAVTLATAVGAPLAGSLAAKYSLRLIMLIGAILATVGYVLLALTATYPLYLIAYGLFIGPSMATGVILSVALVTRWYVVNRGRTLGIVCAQLVIVVMPLVATQMLQVYGLPATFLLMAALSALAIIANFFIIDWPPGANAVAGEEQGATDSAITMPQLLKTPRFYGLLLAYIASATGSVVITAHMVPMVKTWGLSATLAATLLSMQSFVGIAGTVVFGWIADRLGGARALVFVALNAAVLWMLLLLQPPYALALVLIGLIGLHGGGSVPAFSVSLGEHFGREGFSRAYGLANLLNLPFSVICVPAAAYVFATTGSYNGAIIGEAVFLAVAGLAALAVGRKPVAAR